jgi:zinc D-Ala-D-Ala carboxypeptidase
MPTSLDYRLSPNFTWEEMTRSGKAEFREQNRREAEACKDALTAVCMTLLEPIRAKFGPLRVNSGFRGPSLNFAVNGSKGSQHMVGQAADFVPLNDAVSLLSVVEWLRKDSGLRWGQLIHEHPGNSRWIHISLGAPWRPANNQQVLDYDGKTYKPIR